MPFPEASPRKHVHTRAIDYRGYEREDGLWDIEAHMTDTKTYEFSNKWRGTVPVGEPMHEMLLRVTIDDSFVIQDIFAATEHSPFQMCPAIAPNYKKLIGIKMGPGWRKAIRMKVVIPSHHVFHSGKHTAVADHFEVGVVFLPVSVDV